MENQVVFFSFGLNGWNPFHLGLKIASLSFSSSAIVYLPFIFCSFFFRFSFFLAQLRVLKPFFMQSDFFFYEKRFLFWHKYDVRNRERALKCNNLWLVSFIRTRLLHGCLSARVIMMVMVGERGCNLLIYSE